jgi:4-amino-4-deoxy-L-arabinose transferase-like glycosyltransferase
MPSAIAHQSEESGADSPDRRRDAPAPPSLTAQSTHGTKDSYPQAGLNGREHETAQEHRQLTNRSPEIQWRRFLNQRGLLYLTGLAFLLRLFVVWHFEQVISPDGVQYVALGRSLMAGNFQEGLSTYWSPLYPLLVGLSSLFFHDVEFAGRFVSVIAGSLLVIPSYRLIQNWYGERVALVGAGLVALHPLLIYYSTALLTESTYTLFFTCGVLSGWSALSRGRARSFLLTGLAFGACYLLKPEAAGFFLLLLVPTLGRKLFAKACSFKSVARDALLLCAGFTLLAAPYLFYLRQQTGAWTLSGKAVGHLWQGNRMAGTDPTLPAMPLIPDATTMLVQVTKALRGEYEIFNLVFPPTFVLLAGLGLFRKGWARDRWRREVYLFAFVGATLAGYAVALPNIRFFISLLPILLCWSAKGFSEFVGWVTETALKTFSAKRFMPYARQTIAPLIFMGLLVSLLPLSAYLWRGDKWGDYYGQKRAAIWIKEHEGAHAPVIMSTVPVAAFYARGRYVELYDEEYATLIARAQHEGVGYLIVNERDFKHMRARSLLDDQSFHPRLRLVYSHAESLEHRILVYALDEIEPGVPQRAGDY